MDPPVDAAPEPVRSPRVAVAVPVAELRSRLGDTLGRVRFGGERLVLTAHGTPIAAVVCLDDLERLEQVDVVGIPTPAVEERVVLTAGVARVWRALVEGRYRSVWWPMVTLEVWPGERVHERRLAADGHEVELRGQVVAVEVGASFTFTWAERGCARETTVTLLLTVRQPDETELVVTETGFGPLELARAAEHARRWAELTGDLAGYLTSAPG